MSIPCYPIRCWTRPPRWTQPSSKSPFGP
jgi:hypothetical protein